MTWDFFDAGENIRRRSICDPRDCLISTSKSHPLTRVQGGQMREQDDDRCSMRGFYSSFRYATIFLRIFWATIFHPPSALFGAEQRLIYHNSLSQSANENLSGSSSGWRTWSTCSTRRRRTSTRCWRWSATSRPGRRESTSKAWRSVTCDFSLREKWILLESEERGSKWGFREKLLFGFTDPPSSPLVPFKVPLISIKLCQPTWLFHSMISKEGSFYIVRSNYTPEYLVSSVISRNLALSMSNAWRKTKGW